MTGETSWANIVSLRNPDGSLDSFRLEETLPLLTDKQIDSIRPFAVEQEIPSGQLVLREGQTELDFLVVLSGSIEFSASRSFESRSVLSRAICLYWRILRLRQTGERLKRPESSESDTLTSGGCSRPNPT